MASRCRASKKTRPARPVANEPAGRAAMPPKPRKANSDAGSSVSSGRQAASTRARAGSAAGKPGAPGVAHGRAQPPPRRKAAAQQPPPRRTPEQWAQAAARRQQQPPPHGTLAQGSPAQAPAHERGGAAPAHAAARHAPLESALGRTASQDWLANSGSLAGSDRGSVVGSDVHRTEQWVRGMSGSVGGSVISERPGLFDFDEYVMPEGWLEYTVLTAGAVAAMTGAMATMASAGTLGFVGKEGAKIGFFAVERDPSSQKGPAAQISSWMPSMGASTRNNEGTDTGLCLVCYANRDVRSREQPTLNNQRPHAG